MLQFSKSFFKKHNHLDAIQVNTFLNLNVKIYAYLFIDKQTINIESLSNIFLAKLKFFLQV